MSGLQLLVGTYLLGLEPMLCPSSTVKSWVGLEGVPEELSTGLVGSNCYVVVGTQLEGATFDFDDGDPAPGGRRCGIIDFVRADDTTMSTSGRGLRLEGLEWEAGDEDLHRELADRTAARSVSGAILVPLIWDDEIAGIWDEYLETRRRFNPDLERTLTLETGGRATIEVRPEGFLQAFEASLLQSRIQLER